MRRDLGYLTLIRKQASTRIMAEKALMFLCTRFIRCLGSAQMNLDGGVAETESKRGCRIGVDNDLSQYVAEPAPQFRYVQTGNMAFHAA